MSRNARKRNGLTIQNLIMDMMLITQPMTNKELQEILKQYPDDAIVVVEYCNIRQLKYQEDQNIIKID